ncbi:hypothetical protein [Haloarchaeobius sp. DT45]|uniref:hypothetical protein n=1 Tax=Haloarchaeobius sp. DT45 TaxID=3446116 RepID=UPI003F6CDC4F
MCIAVSMFFAGLTLLLQGTGPLPPFGLLFVCSSLVFAAIMWRHVKTREPALSPFVRRANAVLAYVMLGLGVGVLCLSTWVLSSSLTAG